MPIRKPKWQEALEKDEPVRKRSVKQESNLAKSLKGVTTFNSGATFGQNDVLTDYCEIEVKYTDKDSFRIDLKTWSKLHVRCNAHKIPLMVVELQGVSFAVLKLPDLKFFIDEANTK